MLRKVALLVALLWFACIVFGACSGWLTLQLRRFKQSPAEREATKLRDLYDAKLFDDAIIECDRAERDSAMRSIRPQIEYVRWAAERKLGHTGLADQIGRQFLADYSENALGADIRFANAVSLIRSTKYADAEHELQYVTVHFPGAPVHKRAAELLDNVRLLIPSESDASGS